MEIQLPEVQSYFDKIRDGSITGIRPPGIGVKPGEVLTALSPTGDDRVIKLKVLSSEAVPLAAITAEEAEQEGVTVPGFCASQFLCGNIETRLDFEDYAFKYENGVPVARTRTEHIEWYFFNLLRVIIFHKEVKKKVKFIKNRL